MNAALEVSLYFTLLFTIVSVKNFIKHSRCFHLQKILPPEYDYIVISSKVDKSTVLEAVLRVNIFTEESGKLWISQLEDVARLNYSCSRTFNPVSKVVFKVCIFNFNF